MKIVFHNEFCAFEKNERRETLGEYKLRVTRHSIVHALMGGIQRSVKWDSIHDVLHSSDGVDSILFDLNGLEVVIDVAFDDAFMESEGRSMAHEEFDNAEATMNAGIASGTTGDEARVQADVNLNTSDERFQYTSCE